MTHKTDRDEREKLLRILAEELVGKDVANGDVQTLAEYIDACAPETIIAQLDELAELRAATEVVDLMEDTLETIAGIGRYKAPELFDAEAPFRLSQCIVLASRALEELREESPESVSQRDARQALVAEWGVETFGASTFTPERRALRFLEEALEMAQACGVSRDRIANLIFYVYQRPVGEPAQELGGCGVTLLALAYTLNLSADDAERDEIARVLAIPPEQFRKRHDAKADAGVATYSDRDPSLPSVEVQP